VQAVALHTAGRLRDIADDRLVTKLLKEKAADPNARPLLRELAEHALKEQSKTAIKSIAGKGEKAMQNRDLLKEKYTIVERVIAIKKIPLFRSVDSEHLKLFAEITTEQRFARDQLIVRENDQGEFLYLIKSGSVKVVKNHGKNETVLSILPEGGHFGEMGLIDNEPRSASCVANEECSILIMGKDDFLDVLYRSPEIALELFKLFTQRIRQNNERILQLTAELEKARPEKTSAT
jgi:hypothetical protein